MSHQKVKHHHLITISLMLATIMQALDTTIANVALPRMQGTLAATQDQMSWVLTSYILASAIMIPLTGWLAVKFERKHVFLISVASFTIASVLCGMAVSLPQMVAFRVLQGISGAALVPLSQAILFDINPPEHFGRAMAMWGVGVMLGPIVGPALGGWLTEDYNWRWVFFINLPIGILTLAGLYLFLPPAERRPLPDFDFFGFATLSVAIGGLQLMLDRGELLGWFGSTEIVTEAVLAGLGFYLFLVHSATHRHPFISPALFKDRNFLVGNFLIFSIGMVMFANLALLPQLLQTLLGYPVLTAGILIAPRGIGTMAAMLVVGRIMGKIDPRLIMGIGLGLMALSLWQMTGWSLDMNSAPFVTAGLIQGLGIGLVWVPLSAVAFTTLNPHFRSEGTAFFSLLRNVGSSIGISVVQFLLTQNTQINHATLNEHASVERLWGMSRTALAFLNAQVTRQAAMIAFLDDFQLMLILTLGSIPLLLIFRKNGGNKPDGHAAVME